MALAWSRFTAKSQILCWITKPDFVLKLFLRSPAYSCSPHKNKTQTNFKHMIFAFIQYRMRWEHWLILSKSTAMTKPSRSAQYIHVKFSCFISVKQIKQITSSWITSYSTQLYKFYFVEHVNRCIVSLYVDNQNISDFKRKQYHTSFSNWSKANSPTRQQKLQFLICDIQSLMLLKIVFHEWISYFSTTNEKFSILTK